MSFARVATFGLGVAASFCLGLPSRADPAEYRLGPQDQLQIKVYDWRTGSGSAYQWAALDGAFSVGASGSVSLPLLGEIPASNGTTAELAAAIGARLQSKIGLAQRPDASVQVIKYRPFYIMGGVEKAGEYDYRPGLTVLQAMSMAGGLTRLSDDNLLGYEREALVNRGDLRVLAADRQSLLVRQARLDAEINDLPAIVLPADIKARLDDPDVARAVREEQLLFEAQRDAVRTQTEALKQAKALLQQELASLAAKDASLVHQLDITKKELSQVSALVAKGLAVVPRQLAAEQSSASFESNRLDVQLATLRAQQDLSKADRDMLDLRAKRRSDALTEATDVRAKLAGIAEKMDTAQSLIYQSEVRAPLSLAAADGPKREPVYLLTRRVNGQSQTSVAKESDLVQPGDVVRVELPRRGRLPGGADRAGQTPQPNGVNEAQKAASGF